MNDEGEDTLRYRSNRSFESVSLLTIKWVQAKGNGKCYLPPGFKFPHQPAKTVRFSKEHKVKGFADDLTVISTHQDDHQDMLSRVDFWPDKCYS